jgi:hypothetical protein
MKRERLVESASGLRHLRWVREILGTLEAHHEHDGRLTTEERDAVLAEIVELRALVVLLSSAVKAYRDFLERERTRFRGMLRVGRYLEETAQGADERTEAEAIRVGFEEAFAAMEARERAPRKRALREAIQRVQRGLAAMDGRLAAKLPATLVESLYPTLTSGGTVVADAGDEDDDAAG